MRTSRSAARSPASSSTGAPHAQPASVRCGVRHGGIRERSWHVQDDKVLFDPSRLKAKSRTQTVQRLLAKTMVGFPGSAQRTTNNSERVVPNLWRGSFRFVQSVVYSRFRHLTVRSFKARDSIPRVMAANTPFERFQAKASTSCVKGHPCVLL